MSFDHWWVGFWLSSDDYERLKAPFDVAAAKAVLSSAAQAAVEAWRHHPAQFEQGASAADEDAWRANDFIWAFNLAGFDEFGARLLTLGGEFASFDAEENLFRMVSAARHTPVGVLWHALGFERARRLPGQMGNLLLHPSEVASARERVAAAYAGSTSDELLEAGKRYCGWSVGEDTLRDIFSFLPDGLSQAAMRNKGFLAIARAQI